MREGPRGLGCCYQDLVSHVNSNFLCTYIYINGGSHGKGCCRNRIRKWTRVLLCQEFQIVIILGHLALVLLLPWLSGIGSDVALVIWYWF